MKSIILEQMKDKNPRLTRAIDQAFRLATVDKIGDCYPERRASWSLSTDNISEEEIEAMHDYIFYYRNYGRNLNEDPNGEPTFAPNFINGRWEGNRKTVTLNAHFDRRVPLVKLPDSGEKEAKAAVDAAYHFWTSLEWAKETLSYRKWVIDNFVRILNHFSEDCLREIRHQIPKTLLEAKKDFYEAKRAAAHMVGAAETVMKGEISPQMVYGHHYWRNEFLPIGVSTLLTPMNFIYGIPVIQLVGAYLAGVPIIFKGHPFAGITNTVLMRMLLAAGADPRQIQKVEGFGSKIERLALDPRVARVSLTGSEQTAKQIQSKLDYPDKLYFEGGGCNWIWVDAGLSDEKLQECAERLASAKLSLSSHKCTTLHGIAGSQKTLSRLVPLIKKEMSKWNLGDPRKTDDSKTIGPLMVHKASNIDRIAMEAGNNGCVMHSVFDKARERNREEFQAYQEYMDNTETGRPLIIENVTPETEITIDWDDKGDKTFKLATTELFLPVLITMKMNFERFIDFCLTENPHSLATSIYTRDSSKIEQAKRVLGGMLKFNDGTDSAMEWEEFGGSGIGPSGNMGVGEAEATIKIFCRKQKGRYVEF